MRFNTALFLLAAVVLAGCQSSLTANRYYLPWSINSVTTPVDPSGGEWAKLLPFDSHLKLAGSTPMALDIAVQKGPRIYKERWRFRDLGFLYYEQLGGGSFTHESSSEGHFLAAQQALSDSEGVGILPADGVTSSSAGRVRYMTFETPALRCTAFRQLYGGTGVRQVVGESGDRLLTRRFCAERNDPKAAVIQKTTFEFLNTLRQNGRAIVAIDVAAAPQRSNATVSYENET